jgi:hypothetical protein
LDLKTRGTGRFPFSFNDIVFERIERTAFVQLGELVEKSIEKFLNKLHIRYWYVLGHSHFEVEIIWKEEPHKIAYNGRQHNPS